MSDLAAFVRRIVGDACDRCDRPTRVLHGLSPALCSRCWAAHRREVRA